MLEKGSYVPWSRHFLRYVDGKKQHGIRVKDSFFKGPYKFREITDPESPTDSLRKRMQVYADLTGEDKLRYEADIDAINWILLGIPNDIYNSVDALQDYDDDYQGEIQGDEPEDKLSTTMMILTRAITQQSSTPSNNYVRTSSSMKNQAYVQDGWVDIQGKCSGGHYARDCSKLRVQDSKYFIEHMLLAAKDEAGVHLDEVENDFMLIRANGDDQLKELNALVIMMARL
uniref:Uncharacterized protein n=1 Tax=Tanacetum cinerariifolium TaxID=118510 RepID=A0A699GJB3_TANCI|nr:hypothetical protein [Tanacetum cinerariifolium]